MFIWSFYLPEPIIESGIAYYTIDYEVYNLYLYPAGVFIGHLAQVLISTFLMCIVASGIFLFLTYAWIVGSLELEYIDIYVYRKCGNITFYGKDEVSDISLDACRSDKTKWWIISEMKYYIDKFKIPVLSNSCENKGNYLTKDLKEWWNNKWVILAALLCLVGLCLLVIFSPDMLVAY